MTGVLAGTRLLRTPRAAACGMARSILYEVESGAFNVPAPIDRHRRECLVCQATTVRQRRILRELASLHRRLEPLPYDIAAGFDDPRAVLLANPGPRRRRNRVGTAVASAASVAAIGALVLAGRRMRSPAGGG